MAGARSRSRSRSATARAAASPNEISQAPIARDVSADSGHGQPSPGAREEHGADREQATPSASSRPLSRPAGAARGRGGYPARGTAAPGTRPGPPAPRRTRRARTRPPRAPAGGPPLPRWKRSRCGQRRDQRQHGEDEDRRRSRRGVHPGGGPQGEHDEVERRRVRPAEEGRGQRRRMVHAKYGRCLGADEQRRDGEERQDAEDHEEHAHRAQPGTVGAVVSTSGVHQIDGPPATSYPGETIRGAGGIEGLADRQPVPRPRP